ncbi:hypothetical protein JKP88DRAFT_245125 [Tribonema minus]|uniref:Uncharacterized protein n=1 Tax=Tribonema minus TaxID=303371 RepID=A0A836CFM0_9STRA|nr:hypothetical protein JKP88DRAFT_245125 [Tribonema minus]
MKAPKKSAQRVAERVRMRVQPRTLLPKSNLTVDPMTAQTAVLNNIIMNVNLSLLRNLIDSSSTRKQAPIQGEQLTVGATVEEHEGAAPTAVTEGDTVKEHEAAAPTAVNEGDTVMERGSSSVNTHGLTDSISTSATIRQWDTAEERAVAHMACGTAERRQHREEQRTAMAANEQVSKECVAAVDTAAAPVNTYTIPQPPRPVRVCSAVVSAPAQRVPTTAQPDSAEPEPAALCAARKPAKLPVEVKTVNLWDAREREEHTLAYFAYTQQLAEERRAAKRAAEAAKQQRSEKRGMNKNELTAGIVDSICCTQNDRCIYSGLPVKFERMSDWQASLERLNNDDDYLVGNSALCALEFNVAAGWTVAKAMYAATHTNSVDTATLEANVREALSKPTSKRKAYTHMQHKKDRGVTLTLCSVCCVWRMQDDFHKKVGTVCKGCRSDQAKRYGSTWRGAFKRANYNPANVPTTRRNDSC